MLDRCRIVDGDEGCKNLPEFLPKFVDIIFIIMSSINCVLTSRGRYLPIHSQDGQPFLQKSVTDNTDAGISKLY